MSSTSSSGPLNPANSGFQVEFDSEQGDPSIIKDPSLTEFNISFSLDGENPVTKGDVAENCEIIVSESSDSITFEEAERSSSAAGTLAMTIKEIKSTGVGRSLFGVSGKELKEGLKEGWEKDKEKGLSKSLRILKSAGRMAGVVTGSLINLVARAAAFSIAVPVAVLGTAVTVLAIIPWLIIPSFSIDNPRMTIVAIICAGTIAGAGAGAAIGSLGSLCMQSALNLEFEDAAGDKTNAYGRAVGDLEAAALLGSAIGTASVVANPLLWPAIWTKG